jgi:hypothetical protein
LKFPDIISQVALDAILRFWYTDSLNGVSLETLVEMMTYAQVQGDLYLYKCCGEKIWLSLTPENCVGIWRLAEQNGLEEVQHLTRKFIYRTCYPAGSGFYQELMESDQKIVQELVRMPDELNFYAENAVIGSSYNQWEIESRSRVPPVLKTIWNVTINSPQVKKMMENEQSQMYMEISDSTHFPSDTTLFFTGPEKKTYRLDVSINFLRHRFPKLFDKRNETGSGSLSTLEFKSKNPKVGKKLLESILLKKPLLKGLKTLVMCWMY